jgi:hypothetical protein
MASKITEIAQRKHNVFRSRLQQIIRTIKDNKLPLSLVLMTFFVARKGLLKPAMYRQRPKHLREEQVYHGVWQEQRKKRRVLYRFILDLHLLRRMTIIRVNTHVN